MPRAVARKIVAFIGFFLNAAASYGIVLVAARALRATA